MSRPSAPAVLGNTRTIALIAESGAIDWLSLPTPDGRALFDAHANAIMPAGCFTLAPSDVVSVERTYVGETAILQTTFTTPGGRANVVDFLPVRVGAGAVPKLPHQRFVRMVECIEGEVQFLVRFAPYVDGQLPAVVLDPNGVMFVGSQHTLLLQTEANLHRQVHEVGGRMVMKKGHKRHFVLTLVEGTDPEVPEMRATEPEWDFDATLDYWLAWGRRCAFKGVQRDHVLRLAASVKAACLSNLEVAAQAPPVPAGRYPQFTYAGFCVIAPIALAAWGWEEQLASTLADAPRLVQSAHDVYTPAIVYAWLAHAEATSLMSGSTFVKFWPAWLPLVDGMLAAAGHCDKETMDDASWRSLALPLADGLLGAADLVDDLLLSGDAALWRAAAAALQAKSPGPRRSSDSAFDELLAAGELAIAIDAIEAELAEGGYLQARRRMDRWLLAYDPLALGRDLHSDARALFLAARLYLVEPPVPGRVHMPGDLGE
jgi:hypothetical protein